jgi:serine/threonine-protein kinase
MAATAPKKIGKYEILDVIGKGGMGIVYRAKDPFLDRIVAIKMMTISYADYPDLLQRFYREAKSTANLTHPNIVTVYELGEHEGSPYMAMQYLEGSSLESLIRSQTQLPILQKIDIIIQVCHGLAYAHQREIVHRDIKPGNIMVLKDGSVKIVDFGIARIGDTNFTRTGQFMGSLNYMSLEQLNEKLQVDQRTDVYSTGVVLYQFLTGALPFEAESTGATLMKIFNEQPPPFSKFLSSFPPELETITLKALAKDRDQRYSTADEFALDLTQLHDRLKEEVIAHHMRVAEEFLQRNELFRANEELLAVLKIDKQHSRATSLLRSLRKQIEKEQSVERARQFKEQAEEAFRREEFDPALSLLDQAISLDTTNPNLQELRGKVQAAKSEAEHVRQVLQKVENAHRSGNLDTAMQAIEEVLALRPNDTRVKSLHRIIQKELDDRLKQKRLDSLLEAARKEITNRRYTAAFDILKEAEKVDPEAPQLRALIEKFTTAREQEQRRKELEQVSRQIEQAINTDDYQSALTLAAESLRKFPNDPTLVKLRDLAEAQRQASQAKAFVREKIAAAREILNAGNATGAIRVLEDALQKAPGNPHLESLISIAQERLAQERTEQAKSQCLQQANNALSRRAFDEAVQLLEAGQVRFANSTEIDNLLRFAREQQAKATQQQEIESSVRRAQEFLRAQEYDRAIELLEYTLSRVPDEDIRAVLEEAQERRDEFNLAIEAAIAKGEQFLAEGSQARAAEFLQSQPTAFRKSDKFRELLMAAGPGAQAPSSAAMPPRTAPPPRPPETPPPVEEELEAPPPSATMMWDRPSAIPEVERPTARVTPRVPTGPVSQPPTTTKPQPPKPQPVPPVSAVPLAAQPGMRKLSKQYILLAAVGLVLLIVVAIIFWPSSGVGTLAVRANVEGAEVFVDEQSVGIAGSDHDLTVPLKTGQRHIRVQKQGYDQLPAQTVDITKGKVSSISFNFPPPPLGTGTISIQTNVDSVDVYIDNDPKRVTEGKRLDVKVTAGDHEIRVEKNGYNQIPSVPIHVNKDQTASVPAFTLTPIKGATQVSYLQIKSQPGTRVSVDQKPYGNVGQDGNLRVQVEPKQHLVELTHEGYLPWTESRAVKQGETLQVMANLVPKPAPKPTPKPATPAPTVNFSANPTSVAAGQPVQLSWQTSNASDVSIDTLGGNLQANGSRQVAPTQDTIYTLTAKGEGGTVTKQVSVTVAALPTVLISANPPTIKPGQSTTLTWQTHNATQVTMPGNPQAGLNGSITVSPDKTAMFTIEARGPGGVASSAVQVIVASSPPPPSPSAESGHDLAAIKDALSRLSAAYATQLVDEVKKEWTGMNRQQEKGLKDLFGNPALKALTIQYESCGNPSSSGDTASITCTEVMSYTADRKRQTIRNQVAVTLKKRSADSWRVESKFPSGK